MSKANSHAALAAAGPRGGGLAALAVVVAAALFGTAGTAQALLAPDAWPPSVAAVRLLGGAAGLLAFAAWRGLLPACAELVRQRIVWVMGAAVASYQGLFFIALERTSVAVGTLVAIGSAPLLAGLLGWAAGQGRPGRVWALGTAVGVAGLALLTLTPAYGESAGGAMDVWGVVAAIGAGASYAIYTVIGVRLAGQGHRPAAVMAVPFSIGALLLSPFLLAAGSWLTTSNGLLLALWLGLAATALAYILFGSALPWLAPGTIATLTLTEPLVATLLGVVVLSETLLAGQWLGCLLILLAVTLIGVWGSRTSEVTNPQHATQPLR